MSLAPQRLPRLWTLQMGELSDWGAERRDLSDVHAAQREFPRAGRAARAGTQGIYLRVCKLRGRRFSVQNLTQL